MLDVNPVSEYVVTVLAVFATILAHVVPPLADLSILYPVIGYPFGAGEVQLRLIFDDDAAVAASPVTCAGGLPATTADDAIPLGAVPPTLIPSTLHW